MWRALIVVLLLALSACASLGPLTEGSAPGLAWHAADAALMRKTAQAQAWMEYGFALVVKETRGVALTLQRDQDDGLPARHQSLVGGLPGGVGAAGERRIQDPALGEPELSALLTELRRLERADPPLADHDDRPLRRG